MSNRPVKSPMVSMRSFSTCLLKLAYCHAMSHSLVVLLFPFLLSGLSSTCSWQTALQCVPQPCLVHKGRSSCGTVLHASLCCPLAAKPCGLLCSCSKYGLPICDCHLAACGPMCESHILGLDWPVKGTSGTVGMVALDGICSIQTWKAFVREYLRMQTNCIYTLQPHSLCFTPII